MFHIESGPQIYGFLGDELTLDAIFTLTVVFMVSKRLSAMAVSDFDPYSAGEGAVCSLLFGNSEEEEEDSKAKTASAPSKVLFDSTNKADKRFKDTVCLRKLWSHNYNILYV